MARRGVGLLLFLLAGAAAARPQPQPLHPLRLAAADGPAWPAPDPKTGRKLGDVRAVLKVPAAAAAAGTAASARIFWRRRDPFPALKAVVVTDSRGAVVPQPTRPQIRNSCGVVHFVPNRDTTFYVYYLAFYETGGGAATHFSWFNCTQQEDHRCVLQEALADDDICAPAPAAAAPDGVTATVVALESRRVGPGSGRVDFHALDEMELVATPRELATLRANAAAASTTASTMMIFMEYRERAVKMFDHLPASWARRGRQQTSLSVDATLGEYMTFQIGVWASSAETNLTNFSVAFHPSAGDLSSAAFTCFNLGGTDYHGETLDRTSEYYVPGGAVGSLWIGVDLKKQKKGGVHTGTINISVDETSSTDVHTTTFSTSVQYSINVTVPAEPLPFQGDGDIYSLSRLRWLNSDIGIDDTVPAPFTAPLVSSSLSSPKGFTVTLLNKEIDIAPSGFPSQITVNHSASSLSGASTYTLLANDVTLRLVADGDRTPLDLVVKTPAAIVGRNNTGVYWSSVLTGGCVEVRVTGNVEFDSFLEFTFELLDLGTGDAGADGCRLSDVQLVIEGVRKHARFLVGLGVEGIPVSSDTPEPVSNWRWNVARGNNMLWMGRVEAGVFVKLRGPGTKWEDPMFSSDFGTIPFIPHTWGGANVRPGITNVSTLGGANITVTDDTVTFVGFSGPRTVAEARNHLFQFDMAATPSKPLNLSYHFEQRYLQVGYGGIDYLSPQQAAALNVSVVTLHQGIPGIINDTLVNPYINYPFVPVTVAFMENFTSQARALGMRTKFYYTIRELSNHAAELHALRAIGGPRGETLVSGDPYFIPQPGYCQAWDCHGGAAWLHQHLVSNYNACWQQALSDGEYDAAVCDVGTTRWFNYYVKGLEWSTSQAPHIEGIYYDGINFDRKSMRRVRKVLNAGAAAAGNLPPLVDIHHGDTGKNQPSVTRYLSHFPYATSAWNGEGFNWDRGPAYWLVDASGFLHGVGADRLGGGGYDFKALLFAMYSRNNPNAVDIWEFWRQVGIGESDMEMHGWWSDTSPVTLRLGAGRRCTAAPYSKRDPEGANSAVLATTHVASGRLSVVVIASWCTENVTVSVDVDWDAIGLDKGVSEIMLPDIPNVQAGGKNGKAQNVFQVQNGQGLVLVVREKRNAALVAEPRRDAVAGEQQKDADAAGRGERRRGR